MADSQIHGDRRGAVPYCFPLLSDLVRQTPNLSRRSAENLSRRNADFNSSSWVFLRSAHSSTVGTPT